MACEGFEYTIRCCFCRDFNRCIGADIPLFNILIQESFLIPTIKVPNEGLNKKLTEVRNEKEKASKEEM